MSINGAIAQLGEHLLCKQGVVGSIPTGSTIQARNPVLFDFENEVELFFNNSEVVLTSKIQAKSFLIFDFFQVNHVAFREPDM